MNRFEKTAQHFIVSFDGTELTPALANWLLECRPGGVILFGRNVQSLVQVSELNRSFQELARQHGLPPFIISIDEEGGRVSRLPASESAFIAPSPMAQAQGGEQSVRACAGITAKVLRSAGFNLNLTPLADVNNNPNNPVIGTRSFGTDPLTVAGLAAAAIEEYTRQGIGSCAKHFPGHGDTITDSHLSFTMVDRPRSSLETQELVPFRTAIAAGVPAIMTAHILYPQIEPDYPATLSYFWLTRVLREELGYQGLILTDALEMKAIADHYTIPEAGVMALKAGADLILPCNTATVQIEAIQTAAIYPNLDLDDSYNRIIAFKEKFCGDSGPAITGEQTAEFAAVLGKVAAEALFVEGEGVTFPLQIAPTVIDFTLPMASPVEEGRQPGLLLEQGLRASWPNLIYHSIPANPAEEEIKEAVKLAGNAELTLVLLRKSRLIPAQQQALQALAERSGKLVVVAALDPYDLKGAPEGAVRIATYGDAPCSVAALLELLTGRKNG